MVTIHPTKKRKKKKKQEKKTEYVNSQFPRSFHVSPSVYTHTTPVKLDHRNGTSERKIGIKGYLRDTVDSGLFNKQINK